MLKVLKYIFSKKNRSALSFKDRFFHFQKLIEANDEVHKSMSELSELVNSGKPFLRSYSMHVFEELLENALQMAIHLTKMNNGKYMNLVKKVEKIGELCNKFLSPRLYCPKGWQCDLFNCDTCTEDKIFHKNVKYYYNMSEIDSKLSLIVGGKMARLGDVRNKLNIPTPGGFCIGVKLFNDFMEETNIRKVKTPLIFQLDFNNISDLVKGSREIQAVILSLDIPQKIESKIYEAYDSSFGNKSDVALAVRSSAIGEDSQEHSFAGLHHTELNVKRENLIDACWEVLISKYSPQSLIYRFVNGIRDEDMPMSIGCIEMIDSAISGVIFTGDPEGKNNIIVIQAVRGLGSTLVGGVVDPQTYVFNHDRKPLLLDYKEGSQIVEDVLVETGRTKRVRIEEPNGEKLLDVAKIKTLIKYALDIEDNFIGPQDIEYTIDKSGKIFILQARPLKIKVIKNIKQNEKKIDPTKYELLLDKGECASPGIVSGKVFKINQLREIKDFPDGGILVAPRNLPEFSTLINKFAAVITDIGSVTGHLPIIAREFSAPVITNTEIATEILENGMEITVDANNAKVYKGVIPELINLDEKNDNGFNNSYIFKIWSKIGDYIFKLNLTNPNSPDFRPANCRTLHDTARFAHETGMKEMFAMYDTSGSHEGQSRKLIFSVPLDVYLIDLGNGLKPDLKKSYVNVEDIRSKPLLALIKGMTTPGIQWSGPLSIDFKGFANIMAANIIDKHRADRHMGSRSYTLISENYINFFSRLGYHFSRLDSYASDEINKNYINFSFRGGAADPIRKARRYTVIKRILRAWNFSAEQNEGSVDAYIRRVPADTIYELLTGLGQLMGAVRNTDVTLVTDKHIDIFVDAFLSGDPAPARRFVK